MGLLVTKLEEGKMEELVEEINEVRERWQEMSAFVTQSNSVYLYSICTSMYMENIG